MLSEAVDDYKQILEGSPNYVPALKGDSNKYKKYSLKLHGVNFKFKRWTMKLFSI